MFRDELNIKYLPESLILRYLRDESSEKEKFIVEKLMTKDYNSENLLAIKVMLAKGEFKKQVPSEEEYSKFLDLVKKHPSSNIDLPLKNEIEPGAGQIWTTKAIPQLGNYYFEPVVFPKFVYILTNPQPYQLLDDEDYVSYIKELYTMLVLPISLDTEYSTHKDYIIPSGNNSIVQAFMIETWLETNMLMCNLEKHIGNLDDDQVNELLNVYYVANNMEYDPTIYNKAAKGRYHDKDHGEVYEFQRIEEENIEYLNEPVDKLYEFLSIEESLILNQLNEIIAEPKYSQAAEDGSVISPQNQIVQAEKMIFDDDGFEIKFVVIDNQQLYIRLKVKVVSTLIQKASVCLKDKIADEELQILSNIELTKSIHYLHVKKILKNRIIEFSFFIGDRLYCLKNIDFRAHD